MRQAIVTRYHGPGNRVGARISATAKAGRVYLSYDHAASADANHRSAAKELADRYGWAGNWHSGTLPNGDNVFVSENAFPEDTVRTEGRAPPPWERK